MLCPLAIILTGGGVASASGSIAGTTFSRNRFGPYIRNRSVPTNPNTPLQNTVRAAMATLSTAWVETLTAAQRAAWKDYADNVPVLNTLGQQITLTGLNMYVRSNVPRINAGLTRVDAAPTTFDLGSFTLPSIAQNAGSDFDVTFTDTDGWVGEDGAAMLIYSSVPQNATINFFRGPYKPTGNIAGDATTPPTSPANVNGFSVYVAGQKAFFRLNVTRADGRLSNTAFLASLAA